MNPKRRDVNRRFGEALRTARQSANLSQRELAERVGLERTSITMIESGAQAVSLPTLIDLSAALQMSASALVHALEPPTLDNFLNTLESDHPEKVRSLLRKVQQS